MLVSHKSRTHVIYENNIKKGIKKGIYRYQNNMITFEKYFYSLENYFHSYSFVNKDKINHIIERYY